MISFSLITVARPSALEQTSLLHTTHAAVKPTPPRLPVSHVSEEVEHLNHDDSDDNANADEMYFHKTAGQKS